MIKNKVDGLTEFTSKLSEERTASEARSKQRAMASSPTEAMQPAKAADAADSSQWAVLGNGIFRACSATCPALPSGVYGIDTDNMGNLLLVTKRIITDDLIVLPDTASERVLEALKVFWDSKEKFKAKGQIFKRGVMLWGPPGSGKTATLMLLTHDIVKRGGIVVLPGNPQITTRALEEIRRIEPDRPLICVLEDIDETIERFSEHEILALLDGETQIDNVVFVATTNYPERLDKRIVNRPSRFDEIIKIDMPSPEARAVYLRARLSEIELSPVQLATWVSESAGLSIAHLKELVVAVFCLGREYAETLRRLKTMSNTIKSDSGRKIGVTST